MSKQCKNCGTDLPEDASFCPRCAQSQIERRAIKPPRLWRKKALITAGCVLVLAAVGTARGRTHITAFKRTIPQSTVANAGSIALLMLTLGAVGAGTIAVIDGVSFENAIYETISALCTVGLTTGITSGLGLASCLILIIFMFFGRVGIMTISVGFMMANPAEDRITYAQTRVMIG